MTTLLVMMMVAKANVRTKMKLKQLASNRSRKRVVRAVLVASGKWTNARKSKAAACTPLLMQGAAALRPFLTHMYFDSPLTPLTPPLNQP
jgi:hypothetical protein